MDSNLSKIGLWTAVVIGLNAMIGIGIISIATSLAHAAGPAGILSFVFSIAVVLMIALSLSNTARVYPGEGWNYLYPSKWGGHRLGLVSAFSYLVAVIVAMGFLVQEVGRYLYQLIPVLTPSILSIIILALLTLLVIAGTEVSSLGQYIILGSVLSAILITSIVCWYNVDINLFTPFMPKGITSIFTASPSALFGFLGFESIASLYLIVRNPQKNVGRASIIAIILVGMLYMFFASGILLSISSEYFLGQPTLDIVLTRAFPALKYLSYFVIVGVLFGIIGTLHSMIWSLSVLLCEVLHYVKNKTVHQAITTGRFNPKISALLIASAMLGVALIMRGETLVNMTIFFVVPSYILSIASLLFIKEEWTTGRNIITLLGLLGGGIMMYFATKMLLASLMILV